MLQVTMVVYDSIARAQAAFDSGDEVSCFGAEPVRILDMTVRPVPPKSSLAPIAKQAFELMWQTE